MQGATARQIKRRSSYTSISSSDTERWDSDPESWNEDVNAIVMRDRMLMTIMQSAHSVSLPDAIEELREFASSSVKPDDQLTDHQKHLSRIFAQVVNAMRPAPPQFELLHKVEGYVNWQMRRIFDAHSFPCGISCTGGSLYNDPLLMTVAIPLNAAVGWHQKVIDALLQSQNAPAGALGGFDFPGGPLKVFSETIHYDGVSDRVHFTIEGLPVIISISDRRQMYMANLLAKLNDAVGRVDLFYRSVVFIRAWWRNEFIEHLNPTLANAFREDALIVLICGVFAVHGKCISCPFSALVWLLLELKEWNPSSEVFTVQGRISFHEVSGTLHLHTGASASKELHLINSSFLATCGLRSLSGSPDDKANIQVVQTISAIGACPVLHPFDHSNTMGRLELQDLVMEQLAIPLTNVLRTVHAMMVRSRAFFRPDMLLEEDCVNLLFSHVHLRVWHMIVESFNYSSLACLPRRVKYLDLVLETRLSEMAVAEFCFSELKAKGPLSVAELSAALAERTSVPHLQNVLQGRFGSMKDFFSKFLYLDSHADPSNKREFVMLPCDNGLDVLFLVKELTQDELTVLPSSLRVPSSMIQLVRNRSVRIRVPMQQYYVSLVQWFLL